MPVRRFRRRSLLCEHEHRRSPHEGRKGRNRNSVYKMLFVRQRVSHTAEQQEYAILHRLRSFSEVQANVFTITKIKICKGVFKYMNKYEDAEENECPLGGDIANDCAGCAYADGYHYIDGECVGREESECKKTI